MRSTVVVQVGGEGRYAYVEVEHDAGGVTPALLWKVALALRSLALRRSTDEADDRSGSGESREGSC